MPSLGSLFPTLGLEGQSIPRLRGQSLHLGCGCLPLAFLGTSSLMQETPYPDPDHGNHLQHLVHSNLGLFKLNFPSLAPFFLKNLLIGEG